jgi:hypothetical protein
VRRRVQELAENPYVGLKLVRELFVQMLALALRLRSRSIEHFI